MSWSPANARYRRSLASYRPKIVLPQLGDVLALRAFDPDQLLEPVRHLLHGLAQPVGTGENVARRTRLFIAFRGRVAVSFSNGVKKWQTNRVTGQLFLLFFFPFSFFLWIKLGLFLLFLPAFVFFTLITHFCFSLFESGFPRWLPPVADDDSTKGVRTTIPVGFSIAKAEGAPWPATHTCPIGRPGCYGIWARSSVPCATGGRNQGE